MTDCIFLGSKITANGDCSHEIKRCLFLGRKAMTNLDSILKSKDIPLPTNDKCSSSQSYGFSSSHVWMWELDHKEGWDRRIDAFKLWCWRRFLRVLEIKPVNSKENQPWIFIGRTDAKTEVPILWPPDAKNQLIVKDPDAGKNWGQEDKGVTEDEMFGWHHQLNGHEFEQTPGDSEGQESLACCGPWG